MGKLRKNPASAPVKAKCVDCAAERTISVHVWNYSKPVCYWCEGEMFSIGCGVPKPLVTLLGFSENGVFYPAESNPWTQRIVRHETGSTSKRKRRRRYRQDSVRGGIQRPAKPVAEGVVKRPEVKLRPIRDHSHNQAWRNSSKGSE